MMVDPTNYYDAAATKLNAYDSAIQGISQGFALNQMQKQAEQGAAAQRDIATVANNKYSTPQDWARLIAMYPAQATQLKEAFSILKPEQQKNQLNQYTSIFSSLNNDRPDIAKQMVDNMATAYTNAGREKEAAEARQMSSLISASPKTAMNSLGFLIGSIQNPEQASTFFASLNKDKREEQVQPYNVQKAAAESSKATTEAQFAPQNSLYDLRKIQADIDEKANRLSLDKDKLMTDTQIKMKELSQKGGLQGNHPGYQDLQKAVNASVAADQMANNAVDLATKFETQFDGSTGNLGSASEIWKSFTGGQDINTALRDQYEKLKTSGAIANLPPGSASDADVALALKGAPPTNADPKYIASYLRGMAKIQMRQSLIENSRADWINQGGSLAKAPQDMEVNGFLVLKGTPFNKFISNTVDNNLDKIYNETSNQRRKLLQQQPGYQSVAQPNQGLTTRSNLQNMQAPLPNVGY